MRIHSDILTDQDIRECLPKNTFPTEWTDRKSFKRDHAFEIKLTGSSPYKQMGDKEINAATWDEWGAFLGALFIRDPEMTTTDYRDRYQFNRVTRYRFENGSLPEDTHPRHNWQWDNGINRCNKCSAVRDYSAMYEKVS